MSLFKSKAEKDLISIINSLEMNMSNNYKDNAQSDFAKLKSTYEEYCKEGVLKGKIAGIYSQKIVEYESTLKGYSHKEQTPYWT